MHLVLVDLVVAEETEILQVVQELLDKVMQAELVDLIHQVVVVEAAVALALLEMLLQDQLEDQVVQDPHLQLQEVQ
jgi:hypothetical protein